MQPEDPTTPPAVPSETVSPASPATPQPQVIQPQMVPPSPEVPASVSPAPSPTQVITPAAVPPSPAPPPVAPVAPVGPPAPVTAGQMPPQPIQSAQPIQAPGSSGKLKRLSALVVMLAFVVLAVMLTLIVLKHPITRQQVTSAQKTADNFNNDVFDATDSINKAQNADSAATVKTDIAQANAKLDEAQKELATLKKSNVLHDKDVKSAFDALNAKWAPYLSFVRDSASDTQTLLPPLLDFTDKTESLSKSDPNTTAAQAAYLKEFKQVIDSTAQQIKGLNLALPEDKELLSAFQADLSASSTAVAKAQKDLAAGKKSFVIQDDILGVLNAQTTFINKTTSIESRINDKADKLDPGKEYNKLQDSLDKLWTSLKS